MQNEANMSFIKKKFQHQITSVVPRVQEAYTPEVLLKKNLLPAVEKVSVTIPVHNESDNLIPLYRKLTSTLSQIGCEYEIIFINDGSRDSSKEIINHLAENNPEVKAIHFKRNFGQTAAMMAGFDFASGNIIVPMDGDLQNDPEDIPKLLVKLEEGYDVCSGWRRDRQDNAFKKKFVSKVANKLISVISGVRLKDYGCTMKAYRRNVIKGVKLYGEMHRFIPIYASWEGAKIAEVPVNHFPRINGRSNYGLERTLKVILDLIVVTFLDNYAQKPIYVFGGFGVLSFFVSFFVFLYALYLKYVKNISFIYTPLPLISIFSFTTGIMCVLMGLLAEMIMRTYYESQQKKVYLIDEVMNFEE